MYVCMYSVYADVDAVCQTAGLSSQRPLVRPSVRLFIYTFDLFVIVLLLILRLNAQHSIPCCLAHLDCEIVNEYII